VTAGDTSTIEKLSADHDLSQFNRGKEALNRFLQRFALTNQRANAAQTYVLCRANRVVIAYYSLAVGAVEHDVAPSRVTQGLARHAVPVMLLARLAIDRAEQGHGLGKALLKDAVLRTAQAADIAGIRALLVHAKDDEARAWYAHFDFEPSPTDSFHLFLLMKDIKALIGS
jgi:GNAT superfamily N-acetyltransferase